jgi:hypothetical protein
MRSAYPGQECRLFPPLAVLDCTGKYGKALPVPVGNECSGSVSVVNVAMRYNRVRIEKGFQP